MEVLLLRHTTPDIGKGICYGQKDLDVADSFEQELLQVQKSLGSHCFDVVFSSPLHRCYTLAQAVCPENVGIQTDDRLMELDFGIWEGQAWDAISETKEAQLWFDDYVSVRCPGGESYLDLYNRVLSFADFLKNENHQKVLIVTHAGIIRAFLCMEAAIDLKKSFDIPLHYGELKIIQL